MTARVEPRLPRGLRDWLPEYALARQRMIAQVTRVYELYGFVPLSTPAVEHIDVLTGSAGEEAQRSIFTATNPDEEALGLRFDLTVPLARVVSQYKELPRPFRRYQVSPVWRADKPGPGRFREFVQFDIDAVGVPSELADVEAIAALCDALEALAVGPFVVRVSSRGLLGAVMRYAGVPEAATTDVLRVLDKLDKVGPQKVRLELTTGYKDESGDTIRGLGLASSSVDAIDRFLAIRADERDQVLSGLSSLLAGVPGGDAEVEALRAISRRLEVLGYRSDRVRFDPSIARGLAYYTGPVFEAVLVGAEKMGSVASGGRYDGLVERFLGEKVPATGASIGIDRLLVVLEELGRLEKRKNTASVLVGSIDPSLVDDVLAMTFELRRAGIPTELYVGLPTSIGKQLKYADACGIPIVLLYGGNEKQKGVVTVKRMAAGREKSAGMASRDEWLKAKAGQEEIPRASLVETLKNDPTCRSDR